jgi:hypothetical protein
MTSGLSGSPALVQWRSADRSCRENSACTSSRYRVGGAQNDVICPWCRIERIVSALGLPRATRTTVARSSSCP